MHVTVCYWLLYCLPSAVGTLAGLGIGFLGTVAGWIEQGNAMIAQGLAARLFGIEGELVPPNGSGDTTYNYLLVLGLFAISLIVGTLWTLLDRRATDQSNMRDFLRIVLRYTIALAMIGYGLAKFGWEGNQFPPNSSFQLDKTWGDSSPMNVLWAFMGASQAYTMFAGLGEIIAGLLIVWRRTTLIGAAAAFGVMLNVMMLNFCYDVPVKLYSTHLVVMAIMVMLPDAVRLANLFVLNRVVEPADLRGIWQAPWAWWTHWVLKVVVVGYFVLWPVATRIADLPSQWQAYVAEQKSEDMEKYLLNKRGYRWINEVPFNR